MREHLQLFACIKGVDMDKTAQTSFDNLTLHDKQHILACNFSDGAKSKLSVSVAFYRLSNFFGQTNQQDRFLIA